MNFLTLEDINTTLFSNQDYFWYTLPLEILPRQDFTGIKVDFMTISRETLPGNVLYTFTIDNSSWTKGYSIVKIKDGHGRRSGLYHDTGNTYHFYWWDNQTGDISNWALKLYMGPPVEDLDYFNYHLEKDVLYLNFKELNTPQVLKYGYIDYDVFPFSITETLTVGYNTIVVEDEGVEYDAGLVLVNLIKSDFQFNCTQDLVVGKINHVALGTLHDYLPDGDMIGDNTPSIHVIYNNTVLPVTYDSGDYVFDLDLTSYPKEGKIRFYVYVESNKVINATLTKVSLDCSYPDINTITKLNTLISNGGIGRLGADLTLTRDLPITKPVQLLGNDYGIDCDGHKLIVESTLKAESLGFSNGINTIGQKNSSTVELTDCTFTDCTSVNGLGGVIDCDVDLNSLENPTDFKTTLTGCTFTGCDSVILHGGELIVTDCTCDGKIANYDYPYFLYQTDGNAELVRNLFKIESDSSIPEDIKFNSCIFICGETAQINNLSHSDLQKNDINSFLDHPQNNRSIIDLTYYYDLIEDDISLQSDNGYCYAVSDVDFVFKAGILISRGGGV